MTAVLEPPTIAEYLTEVQRLSVLAPRNANQHVELEKYLSDLREVFHSSPEYSDFFEGEYAFYHESYQQSLAYYLKARDIPDFEFFCYRASAYVSFSRGEMEKAGRFVDKALALKPLDYPTLTLGYKVYSEHGEQVQVEAFRVKIQALEGENESEKLLALDPEEETEKVPNIAMEATNAFIADKLGVDLASEEALEHRIRTFGANQSALVDSYLEKSRKPRKIKRHALYVLSRWNDAHHAEPLSRGGTSKLLLGEQLRRDAGGLFIRWNDCGIVLNPGPNFIENFHAQGLFLNDITHVIVTGEASDAYRDVKRIYDLNCLLNKISPELQLIHYYLNQKAYKELSHILKPHYKQERNTVHSLELFLDSPDVEKETFSDEVTLNFFGTTSHTGFKAGGQKELTSSLGIRLDFKGGEKPLTLGYISGMAWSPLISHNLGHCDLLITGFGNTNPNDYGKLNYNETALGYFGTYTLLDEVQPQLLLCSEFGGREGDIRLEVVKKLRKEYETAHPSAQHSPTILPVDNGLFLDLASLRIECSVSKTLLDPKEVVVVRTEDTFGSLHYLSSQSLL